MGSTIIMTCQACGSKLQLPSDIERFACGNCGNEYIVKRTGGAIILAPIEEAIIGGIEDVRVGVDKTASELAIPRLKDEISVLYRRATSIRNNLMPLAEKRGFLGSGSYLCIGVYINILRYGKKKVYTKNDLLEIIDRMSIDELENMLHFFEDDPDAVFPNALSKGRIREGFDAIRKTLGPIVGIKAQIIQKQDQLKRHQQIVDSF